MTSLKILAGGGSDSSISKESLNNNVLHESVFPINEAIEASFQQGKIIGEKEGYEKGFIDGMEEYKKEINSVLNHINNDLLPYIKKEIKEKIGRESEFIFKDFNTFFSIRENFQYTISVTNIFEYKLEYSIDSHTSSSTTFKFVTMDDLIEELLILYKKCSNLQEDILI